MTIFDSVNQLRDYLSSRYNERPIYLTSGGFDPIHVGHIRCIQETVELATCKKRHPSLLKGLVIVIVNADSFLVR